MLLCHKQIALAALLPACLSWLQLVWAAQLGHISLVLNWELLESIRLTLV